MKKIREIEKLIVIFNQKDNLASRLRAFAAGQSGTNKRSPTACSGASHKRALYLRSVCGIISALHGLRCHPPTCISLKLRLSVDSSPT